MTIFVGICGGSKSGKSTLAMNLAKELGCTSTAVINFDSYKFSASSEQPPSDSRTSDPNDFDAGLLADHLDSLDQGIAIAHPVNDNEVLLVEPKPVVIVEGSLLFAFDSLCKRLDYMVFRDCPEAVRTARQHTDQAIQNEIMHDLFVLSYRHKADFVTRHHHNLAEATARIAKEIYELQAIYLGTTNSEPSMAKDLSGTTT